MIYYEFASATHAGRVRTNNEDAIAVDLIAQLALLADGMGGYNAGEVASEMAVAGVRTEMMRWLARAGVQPDSGNLRLAMEKCVDKVNRAILSAAEDEPDYAGMGTTLVLGVFQGPRLMLGHIGDSRCYRLRSGELAQLTRDHSWLQEQMDSGRMTPEQAATSVSRSLLTRAMGVEEWAELEINEFEVQPDDLYLMCSDGLSEMLSDHQILALLENQTRLQEQVAQLIEAANANGGRDNISVILALARRQTARHGSAARTVPA